RNAFSFALAAAAVLLILTMNGLSIPDGHAPPLVNVGFAGTVGELAVVTKSSNCPDDPMLQRVTSCSKSEVAPLAAFTCTVMVSPVVSLELSSIRNLSIAGP